MLVKRRDIEQINALFKSLGDKKFDIKLQYKLIKIKRAIAEEAEIYQEQVFKNCLPYFELDESGKPKVNPEGGYKIKEDQFYECQKILGELNNLKVQVPDIYLTLDELEGLDLTFQEIDCLSSFIQD